MLQSSFFMLFKTVVLIFNFSEKFYTQFFRY